MKALTLADLFTPENSGETYVKIAKYREAEQQIKDNNEGYLQGAKLLEDAILTNAKLRKQIKEVKDYSTKTDPEKVIASGAGRVFKQCILCLSDSRLFPPALLRYQRKLI